MKAKVRLKCRKGRLLKDSVREESFTYEGNVTASSTKYGDLEYVTLTMREALPPDDTKPLPADLYEPAFIGVSNRTVIARLRERGRQRVLPGVDHRAAAGRHPAQAAAGRATEGPALLPPRRHVQELRCAYFAWPQPSSPLP